MANFGILSYGAYIPRRRISRNAVFDAVGWAQPPLKGLAKGARAFAAWDEDAITMGVEAARRATPAKSAQPDALCLATTTAPFLDRQNAGVIAAALDLPQAAHCFDMSGSQRAALSALDAISRDQERTSLLVAADRRPVRPASAMEMLSGDGAAAVALGPGAPIALLMGVNAVYDDFVDHYRTATSQTDYALEERWFREIGLAKALPAAAAPLFDRCGVSPKDVDRLIIPLPNPALAKAAAASLDIDRKKLADPLFDQCGHTGAAHPLLMLADVLDEASPGDLILLTAIGQGCGAALFRVTDQIGRPSKRISVKQQLNASAIEENYTRFLAARGDIDIEWGMRAERDNRTAQTVAYNKSRDIYGFVGGFCNACKTPQFPKSRRCVNPACGALDTQTDYRFAERRAHVKSYTEDWLAFTREPPLIYGNVSFEGGGNVFMEMTDMAPGEASVGAPLEMRFRIKDIDTVRGFHRYFWKAVPAEGAVGDG